MASRHLLVTGAAGFLGSALIVALRKRGAAVKALDLRPPAPELLRDAPGVRWLQLDIADEVGVRQAFPAAVASQGPLSAVIHLAAYYHFGVDERPQYQRTNREGTRFVHQAARACGARRMIFASSMIALEPPADGRPLTESSPADGWTPYGRSKAFGEELLAQEAARLPAVVLRIGGIFSDWCELPPLYSLLRMWTGPGISNRRAARG